MQLKDLEGQEILANILVGRDHHYACTKNNTAPITWRLDHTGERLEVRKFCSPVSITIMKPEMTVPLFKQFCLVASGPSVAAPTLLVVSQVNRMHYDCWLYDPDRPDGGPELSVTRHRGAPAGKTTQARRARAVK